MEDITQYEFVVSAGKRPLWKTILCAVCFTLMLFWLGIDVLALFNSELTEKLGISIAKDIKGIAYLFVGGIFFGLQKDIRIDIDSNKLISIYHIGMISKRHITNAPELQYIAVYRNPKDVYEVNLWYKGNNHYKMYEFDRKSDAMAFGQQSANKLKLDLLDKTVKGESNWIEYKPD